MRWPARAALAVLAPLLAAPPAAAEILSEAEALAELCERSINAEEVRAQGRPRIIDGDTIEIAGVSIRLADMDAPERRDAACPLCGRQAGQALGRFAGEWVGCAIRGGDVYGRLVGICHGAAGDIGAAMVRLGYARAIGERYAAEEAEARESQAGFWLPRGPRPADW